MVRTAGLDLFRLQEVEPQIIQYVAWSFCLASGTARPLETFQKFSKFIFTLTTYFT
jgi:hypothetical protein